MEKFPDSYYLYVLLQLATILFVIYLYCLYKINYWKRNGVQQLNTTNLIYGDFKNAILFRTAPGHHIGDIYLKAPSDAAYVGFYIFHKPCLLLKDPEIIKQILIRDFNNFSNRHFAGAQQKDSIGMINLFGLKNPGWRYLRQKITPTLTKRKLKEMLPLMIDTSKSMMYYLKNSVDDEKTSKYIDVQDIYYKYTADLIANIALGTNTDSFTYPDSEYSKYLMNFFHSFKRMVALVTVFFMPELVQIIGSPILFNSSLVRKMFWETIEYREKSGVKRGDYIDSIIQLKNGKQNPLYQFEGDNLFFQSGTFFSGFESSSTTSSFTLAELAKNKNYQELAREDIKNSIEKHGWTIEALNEMKYLDQCIAESIRLHPPISTVDRYTLQDYKLPNTDLCIKKGTPIFISLYGLHRDKQHFEEPDMFNPERFRDKNTTSDAYIPFGTGPRKCIGMKLGLLHVKVVIAMILLEYQVHQHPNEANKLDSRSTFTSAAHGINIQFTKLNP